MATRSSSVQASQDEPAKVQSLRAEHKRLTRERLVSAAFELLAQYGYRATSVGETAQAAGTTSTTFYRYFTSKSDVVRSLGERINVEVSGHLQALDAIERPKHETLRVRIEQYRHLWNRFHVLFNAYREAASTDRARASEVVPITYQLTESMRFIESMPPGKQRDRLHSRMVLMYLLMDRLFHLVDIQGRNSTADKMVEEFTDILWDSVFAIG